MSEPVAGWFEKNEFLLRRLHSLSGVIPIGVFLFEHLLTNSMAFFGREKFNEHVHWLHNLPYLTLLELFGIMLPIAFHAIYGVSIALRAKPNAAEYPYFDNWRYTLQRVTGYVAFVFIILHLAHFRFAHWFGGEPYVGTADPFELTRQGFLAGALPTPVIALFYAIGTLASVYHLCNGLTTFCITWGITVGDVARKRAGLAFGGLGLILVAWGMMSLRALASLEPDLTRGATPAAHASSVPPSTPAHGATP
ncbi:MAG: hypothetical protein CHACPFDD_04062 [Phycisphaerae bacterium]|nr:hypothetical protein [Phycisphaerae bacterium]